MEAIELNKLFELPFGENVAQSASIYSSQNAVEYEILNDNGALEYLDYVNLSKVLEVLAEFFDVHAAAISKEGLLCGAALGASCEDVFERLIEANSLCIPLSTLGFSKNVTLNAAKLIAAVNIRNLIATSFDKDALDYLLNNTQINVVKVKSPLQELLGFEEKEITLTPFGYLVQSRNLSKLAKSSFKVAGKVKPTQQQAEDAIFAWKIAKYTKSKSAIVAKDLCVRALVQSFHNSVDAVEAVVDAACESSKEAVLAVDGVIESEEVVNAAIQGRIGLIIESGDTPSSSKFCKLAEKYGISYIVTGIRNNRY